MALHLNQSDKRAILAYFHAALCAAMDRSFDITLPAGISLVELEATSGMFGINSIVITAK